MPGTQALTREDIRVAVGRMLGVVKLIEADANGSTTTFLTDDIATENTDTLNGKWLIFTSGQGNIDGGIRQVTDSSVSSNRVTLTFYPALGNAPNSPATAELWDQEYDPEHIHELIKQATRDLTGIVFDPTEDVSLFCDGVNARYDIPTTLEIVYSIYARTNVQETNIHNCDSTWTQATDTGFTQSAETEHKKRGSASLQVDVADVAGALGDFIADATDETLDLSDYTHVEMWVESTVALSSGDYILGLDDGDIVAGGNDLENLNVPAVSADTPTYVRMAIDRPDEASAIISVGLEMNVDKGAHTIHVDDIKAVRDDTAEWTLVPQHLWMVDREARDLVFLKGAEELVGYRLLKLIGGDNPLLMTADTDTNEVPDSYLIYKTAGLLLLSQSGERAAAFMAMADRERRRIQPIAGRYVI
jgi:hypothetical protein